MITEQQINRRTGIFYSYKITIIFIFSIHYSQVIFVFVLAAQGYTEFVDLIFSNIAFWITGIVIFLITFFVRQILQQFEEFFKISSDTSLLNLFDSKDSFEEFSLSAKSYFSFKKQGMYVISIMVFLLVLLISNNIRKELFWIGINLFDYDIIWIRLVVNIAIFLNFSFIGFAIYPLIVSMKKIYDIGKSPGLGILDVEDMDHQSESKITIIQFTNKIRFIGDYIFSITIKMIVLAIFGQIIVLLIGGTIEAVLVNISVILVIIIFSFIPQIQIHALLKREKKRYITRLSEIQDEVRVKLYTKLQDSNADYQEISLYQSKIEVMSSEIKELSNIVTWTYDFPQIFQLFGSAILSFLLLILNTFFSEEIISYIS